MENALLPTPVKLSDYRGPGLTYSRSGYHECRDSFGPHRGGPLGQGVIEGGKVVCPWHGWQWDPKTGQAVQNPAAKIAVYPLKVESGDAMIEM